MPAQKGNPMTFRKPLRSAVICLLAVSLSFLSVSSVTAQTPQPRDERLWQRALAIHRRAIVIDTHNDVTTPMTNDDYDLGGEPPTPYRTSLARMKQGGLTAEFFSLYVKPWYVTHGGAARRTLDMIDSVYRAVERHPGDLMIATSAADIRRAKRMNKIAALMGIEGGHAIDKPERRRSVDARRYRAHAAVRRLVDRIAQRDQHRAITERREAHWSGGSRRLPGARSRRFARR